jgi:hypothetical protein
MQGGRLIKKEQLSVGKKFKLQMEFELQNKGVNQV